MENTCHVCEFLIADCKPHFFRFKSKILLHRTRLSMILCVAGYILMTKRNQPFNF
jgi:hypothetical protein